ncbi:MAG: polysaccharide biosynthesis/export family protein [Nitrospirae bacterium]|nr:polysaccharide biosynthesis/export family protein [Nitrospirota bacterium]
MARYEHYLCVGKASVLFLLVVLFAACSSNSSDVKVHNIKDIPQDELRDAVIKNYDYFPTYRIMSGDILDVLYQMHTWDVKEQFKLAVDTKVDVKFVHVPELNETQTIKPDGTISLPFIGKVQAVDKTVEELSKELKRAYSKILRNPDLYIIIADYNARIKELKLDLHTAPRGLSRLTTVRPDGFATFAMLGDVFVIGKTIPEVNSELNDLYAKMIPGLHAVLFLEKNSGFVVYVLGDVKKPGVYSIVKPITILEAIGLAGSFEYSAKLSDIVVIRREKDKIIARAIDAKALMSMKDSDHTDTFLLRPDDIVYVPKRFITEAAQVAKDIGDLIFFRGWSVGFSWELHRENLATTPAPTVAPTPTPAT